MCCLQEFDMKDINFMKDDVCKVKTKFASHSLRVLYLSDHITFSSQSQISCMLDCCQEQVTVGVDGNMVDVQLIRDIFNSLNLKQCHKLRVTPAKDTYVIKVLWTINSNYSSRIELCICCSKFVSLWTFEKKILKMPRPNSYRYFQCVFYQSCHTDLVSNHFVLVFFWFLFNCYIPFS